MVLFHYPILGFFLFLNSINLNTVSLDSLGFTPSLPLQWRVGQSIQYQLRHGFLGNIGTSTKSVASENSAGFWVTQTISTPIRKEVLQAFVSRQTGKMLRFIRNGEDQPVPDQNLVIKEQGYQQLKSLRRADEVFDTWYVHAQTRDTKRLEYWVNSNIVPIDGAIKVGISLDVGDITLEMTAFSE